MILRARCTKNSSKIVKTSKKTWLGTHPSGTHKPASREGTKFSSAEAVYGAQPILPGQFLAPRSSQCPLWEDSHAYWTSFHSRPTAAARRPAPSQTRPGTQKWACPTTGGRLWRPVPGPEEVTPLLQAAGRRSDRHLLYTQAQTLQITPWRTVGCSDFDFFHILRFNNKKFVSTSSMVCGNFGKNRKCLFFGMI